jgi:hypothetical protein
MDIILNTINDYIVVTVVLACLVVGYIIKHAVPTDKINKFIPLILSVLGIVLNLWINSFKVTPDIIISGLTSGLASTGMHQAFKQFIEKSEEQ